MLKLRCVCLALLLAAGGCGNTIHDDYAKGPVPRGLYVDAVADNADRLGGTDHFVRPFYLAPFDALASGIGDMVAPISRLIQYSQGDTPGKAAREMLDSSSADHRREGTLHMTDFAYTRQGKELKIYTAIYAGETADPDFTVRAAAVRALNICRAQGFTGIFVNLLDKDPDPLVRLEAADALSNIPDPAAIPSLLNHIQPDKENEVDIRMACVDALRNYMTEQVAAALADAVADPDFGVDWQARQSLARITAQDFRYDRVAWLNYLATAGMN